MLPMYRDKVHNVDVIFAPAGTSPMRSHIKTRPTDRAPPTGWFGGCLHRQGLFDRVSQWPSHQWLLFPFDTVSQRCRTKERCEKLRFQSMFLHCDGHHVRTQCRRGFTHDEAAHLEFRIRLMFLANDNQGNIHVFIVVVGRRSVA